MLLLRSQLRGEKPPKKLKSLYRNNGNPLLGISRSTCNNVTFKEQLVPPVPFFWFFFAKMQTSLVHDVLITRFLLVCCPRNHDIGKRNISEL